MQDTELETALAALLTDNKKPRLQLVIGNKNYSSWSMRPWVVMKAFGIPFEEILILLGKPGTTAQILEYSPAGRVPVLLANEVTVWDSLAICEFLAEQFPLLNLWPENIAARAMARSVCAEMHSGFAALRFDMPMNIRAKLPGKGRTIGSQADIGRICEIWEDCLSGYGAHQFLFGDFSIADAYFAPVVMRFRTYGVSLAPALQAYVERVTAHPAVAEWIRDAEVETHDMPGHDARPAF
ncbi:glutathione S-transferase family protein [Undibacterium sp. Jales W-56]|uniref:glutathione S-transferase family protein n=1 Tax=Undibacterium sp. Jales W-56 TaxID=2897325 RepID=UPI0021CF49B9|nr:glutathione S-transferase family protein [Undibacterium sp. Jales W-56]MCU6432234.1 glutathione S-transferase family protein [Undibacterium sp. Jales W-56]